MHMYAEGHNAINMLIHACKNTNQITSSDTLMKYNWMKKKHYCHLFKILPQNKSIKIS